MQINALPSSRTDSQCQQQAPHDETKPRPQNHSDSRAHIACRCACPQAAISLPGAATLQAMPAKESAPRQPTGDRAIPHASRSFQAPACLQAPLPRRHRRTDDRIAAGPPQAAGWRLRQLADNPGCPPQHSRHGFRRGGWQQRPSWMSAPPRQAKSR